MTFQSLLHRSEGTSEWGRDTLSGYMINRSMNNSREYRSFEMVAKLLCKDDTDLLEVTDHFIDTNFFIIYFLF